MIEPLVSILIPVYKRGNLACKAIECALLQDYSNIEVIVGDNHSEDGTYEMLLSKFHKEPKVLIFRNERNLGAVGNWRKCLEKAKGDYVKFLWSDDLMNKSFVSEAINIFKKSDKISFVFSSVIIFNDNKTSGDISKGKLYYCIGETGIYNGYDFIKKHYEDFSGTVPVSPGCAMFKRSKVSIIEYIPNNIGYKHNVNGAGPDLLMFLESVSNGEFFGFINVPLNFFRAHPQSISCSDISINKGYISAKIYFLLKHNYRQFIPYVTREILRERRKFSILDKVSNEKILKSYFGNIKYDIPDNSVIIEILTSKILYKIRQLLSLNHNNYR